VVFVTPYQKIKKASRQNVVGYTFFIQIMDNEERKFSRFSTVPQEVTNLENHPAMTYEFPSAKTLV
jgi:hypothetical protein